MLKVDLGVLALASCALACSSESSPPAGSGGSAGSSASAGSGGSSAGSSASGGSAGSAGSGGSAGASAGSGSGGGGAGGGGGSAGSSGSGGGGGSATTLSFFVTSDTSMTGDLGGLSGADGRCQTLGAAAGAGDRTWRAYLSVDVDPDNGNNPTNARDRIGDGPWYNANGDMLAADVAALHEMNGDPELFIDENGMVINGQWLDSPDPNEHDILTGTNRDGTVATGATCGDWTSSSADDDKQVGHSDGLGPDMDANPPRSYWNSAHLSTGCADTAPAGGAGRIYCFAAD